MADDRSPHSPRRAAPGEDPAPAGPSEPRGSEPGRTGAGSGTTDFGNGAAGASVGQGQGAPGRFTEDEARPIFREAAADADAATVRTPAGSADAPAPTSRPEVAATSADGEPAGAAKGPAADAATGTTTGSRRLNFTPRARPADDEDATTLLPRTTGREGRPGDPLVDPDLDDLDERPRRLGHRARLALLVSAVAAVVVVGLGVGYAVVGVRDQQPGADGVPGGTASSAAAGTPSAAALLDDASMLTAQGATPILPKRTWTAGEVVRGPLPAGSGPGCLGSDPLEGAPTAQQTLSRTVTADGSDAPSALHVAQAYATVEDATQAFAVTAKALGTCAVTGDWIFTGRAVQGVGDEAAAVAVRSAADGQDTQHWVVVSRTGRAIDVVDASTPGKTALNVNDVTAGLASVVGAQCATAGGACADSPSTADAPPPVGGDEPGFFATGDLPPASSSPAPWVGTPVETPSEDFTGSQCESVNWATTAAVDKSSRVYLLQDVPGIFGLNEIVLTAKDEAIASKLVEKVKDDWSSCKERKLTATVDKATKVTGVAEGGASVSGWTTEVEQKAGSTTTRFRVGIASSGTKVAFVFLNPQKGLDIGSDEWNTVTVRGVQRLTQQG